MTSTSPVDVDGRQIGIGQAAEQPDAPAGTFDASPIRSGPTSSSGRSGQLAVGERLGNDVEPLARLQRAHSQCDMQAAGRVGGRVASASGGTFGDRGADPLAHHLDAPQRQPSGELAATAAVGVRTTSAVAAMRSAHVAVPARTARR